MRPVLHRAPDVTPFLSGTGLAHRSPLAAEMPAEPAVADATTSDSCG